LQGHVWALFNKRLQGQEKGFGSGLTLRGHYRLLMRAQLTASFANHTWHSIAIRLSKEMRAAVDAWASKQDDNPGRSESIRRLVEIALKR
jgi:hypothetical protein